MGDWKAIRQKMRQGNGTIELYNLATDVSESLNVADQNPGMVSQFEAHMAANRTSSSLFPLVPFDRATQQVR